MAEFPAIPLRPAFEEVLGSVARVRIARLLVGLPEKEFTGREIARVLGLSHSTVQEALGILVTSGLVSERELGRAHVLRANRESFLYPVLRNLFQSERRLGEEIGQALRSELGKASLAVVLFGSHARGASRAGSDMDLVVVTADADRAEKALSRLQLRFERRYGLRLDAKVLTPVELKSKAGTPFVRAALSEGILVSGTSLEKVLASVA